MSVLLDYYYNDPNKQCSTRDIKGYLGELFVKHGLDTLGLTYTSNPLLSITDWKQYQNSGVDFKLYNVQLEVKNTEARVFRSWILRDWIPRFTYNNETRIVVCPSSIKLSTNVLELLFIHNINILYFDSLRYLKNNIQKNDANKLVLSYNQCPTKVFYCSSRFSSKRILSSSFRIIGQSMKQSIRVKIQGLKATLKHQLSKDTLNLVRRLWSTCRVDQVDQVKSKVSSFYSKIRSFHRSGDKCHK